VLALPDLHKKPLPASDLPPRMDAVLRFASDKGKDGGSGGSAWTKHQQEAVFSGAMELLAQATDCYR